MKAVIVTIGDELLIGQVVDTNSAFLANELYKSGIDVDQILSIADGQDDLTAALDRYIGRVDFIFLTGGLGPTSDDGTKETLASYFGMSLVENEIVVNDVKAFVEARGMILNANNRSQALVPDKSVLIRNAYGTAPGMIFTMNNTRIYSMPGVPFEMKEMILSGILPEIKKEFKLPSNFYKTIITHGIPEAMLAEKLQEIEKELPAHIKLAYLPNPRMIRLRLSAQGELTFIQKSVELQHEKIKAILGEHYLGVDDQYIERIVADLLINKGLCVSTAESCTGGTIAQMITSMAGASAYYKGSVVAYDNDIKTKVLGVSKVEIEEDGAVSERVVKSMVEGALKLMKSDVAIATSGIAGPNGGTIEKPVGTTWIAVGNKNCIVAEQFQFGNHREKNINRSSATALNMLKTFILSKY